MREHDYQPRPVFQSSLPRSIFRSQASLPELERLYSVKVDEPHENLPSSMTEEAGQFHNTFIISQTEDSIILVDQHAAHERIVMEKMKKALAAEERVATQMLLIPEVVDLSLSEKTRIMENAADLEKLGLVVEEFGSTAVIVREIPALIANADIKKLITDLAQEMAEWGKSFSLTQKLHLVCATIACHGSVRAGRKDRKTLS